MHTPVRLAQFRAALPSSLRHGYRRETSFDVGKVKKQNLLAEYVDDRRR